MGPGRKQQPLDKTGNLRLRAAGEDGLPMPDYDDLSLASIRARLRNLDPAQLRLLAEYERAHASRAAILVMFERRIAKLESDQD
jgi:hypothetical protein